MVRFPHVAVIMAAAPSTLPWVEIYKLQLRSEKKVTAKAPELKPSDFVISFEITFKGTVVVQETHTLPDEQDDRFCTKELWTVETAPKWIKDAWESNYEEWDPPYLPTLSIWITRNFKTIQLYDEAEISDGTGTICFFERQTQPSAVEYRGMNLHVAFYEESGRLVLTGLEMTRREDELSRIDILRVLASMLAAI